MSYDVWLTIDTGGPEHAAVGGSYNMTSNVSPMWRLAGADIAEFDGRRAVDVLPSLNLAIQNMTRDPAPYRALSPSNGWGSYDTCLDFLVRLRDEFALHPKATVRVSR